MMEQLSKFENSRHLIKNILDLDDACLLHLFSLLNPLPDLFNAARSCKRFRDLVHTRRRWLVVTPKSDTITTPAVGVPQEHRQQFTSLADAIAASRPGNTILLEPGVHEASNLVISHPLQIIGDGCSPDVCTIKSCCSKSGGGGGAGSTTAASTSSSSASLAAPVLIFTATAGKVSNLSIESGIGGCIVHYKGRLAIEECSLRCDARGLEHLAAPLISLACSSIDNSNRNSAEIGVNTLSRNTANSSSSIESTLPRVEVVEETHQLPLLSAKEKPGLEKGVEIEEEEKEEEKQSLTRPFFKLNSPLLDMNNFSMYNNNNNNYKSSSRCCTCVPGPGVVSVVGCCMEGGSTAVKVTGTGAVQSVRVIYESHKALFYFDVDSNTSAGVDEEQRQIEKEVDKDGKCFLNESENGGDDVGTVDGREHDAFPVPSWVENNRGIRFDPAALQAHITAAAIKR